MVWFWVDDKFHSHNKIRKVLAEDPAALALWVVAGSWSADNLEDGFVPDHQLVWLIPAGADALAQKLVSARLWRRVRGGYQFHDWADWNKTREQVLAKKQARAEAGRKGGLSSGKSRSNGEANASAKAQAKAKQKGTPTLPNPSSSPKGEERADVERICAHLVEKIVSNGSKKPDVTDEWRKDARLLIDKDGRDPDEIVRVIDWCQSDSFWRKNVLSMPTLRKQYDRLRLGEQDNRKRPGNRLVGADTRNGQIDWNDAEMLRL